jgi:precorrin-3B methylase
MSNLEGLIKSSYGDQDLKFAGHAEDIKRAAQAIVEANETQVGYERYIEMHREYLRSRRCPEDDINEQLEKVKDISSYFIFD